MYWLKLNRKKTVGTLLILILAIPAIHPLLNNGFPLTDDGNWMVIRFSAFYEALRGGQFPVRFLSRLNNSYGYPVADFLYPLFMYLGVPIHILGFNFANTVKIIMGGSIILSSVFTFYWLKQRFNNLSSLLGALVYVYFPYHLFDLYKRGSVGELLAMAIAPFIFWQIERKNLALTAFGIGLLILAHNSLAFIFLPVIIFYIVVAHYNDLKRWLISISLGLGLAAFFWIPALYDKQFTVFDKVVVSDYAKYFITPDNVNLYGLLSVVLFLTSLVVLSKKREKVFSYFFLLLLFVVFLTLSVSSFIWKLDILSGFIQFPFRLLSVVCLIGAYLAAFQLNLIKTKFLYLVFAIYAILIVISSVGFIKPVIQNYPDSFYSTNQDSTTVKNEYMPIWVKNLPQVSPGEKVSVIKGHQSIEGLNITSNKITFNFYAPSETLIQVNTVYFPGWVVKLDGKETAINYKDNGLIRFSALKKGTHTAEVVFRETNLRLIADFISLASIVIILLSLKFFKNEK